MVALLLAGARTQPVVLAFEDLHWADPTSLDLIQALAERGAQAPLLVVATTRPEFRAPWGMRSHHAVVALALLDRTEVRRMVGEIAAQHPLPQEVVERVSERTGGVPLFVEEVTRLLLERGDTGSQAVPPTLQQSLAARLDRLGSARELAQIGAVLGRDFVYALLRDVAEMDEPALQTSLDRLGDADLLFVEGAPPEAKYRFKHALIQDAAYESMLKSRRQALHQRAAELLRADAERAAAEPEIIAHHFTEAGLDDLAIEWWGKAGDQALRRSAFQEAIAHLGKAIAMADRAAATARSAPGGSAAPTPRLTQLHVARANALFAARGVGATETTEAFARARESAYGDTDAPERLAAEWGLWASSYTRGELPSMRAHAVAFLSDVETRPESPEAGVAHRAAGTTCWFAGEYREAKDHLERALAMFQPGRDDDLAFRFGHDPGVVAIGFLAITLWPLGEVDRAISLIERMQTRMADLSHVGTLAFGRMHTALFELMRGDAARAAPNAFELARLAREYDLVMWRALGVFLQGCATVASGSIGGGLEGMRRGAELLSEQKVLLFDGLLKTALAEAEARAGDTDRAIAFLDEALATCDRAGNRAFEAELHRVRGEILLKRDPANRASAEEAFLTAIAVAKQQGTRSFELRASLSLARLYQSTSHPAEAHAVLAPALEGFSPTPEMPEIADAQALLAAVAETEDVKAAVTQRRRRLGLQTAYSQAVLWSKGWAASETKTAFERISDLALGAERPGERFPTLYGRSLWSLLRGDVRTARETAEEFLQEAEAEGRPADTGVAHRVLGLACTFQGDLAEARRHLELALEGYVRERDGEVREKFGQDTGVAARIFLAHVLWLSGDLQRSRQLIEEATRLGNELGHLPSELNTLGYKTFIESIRNDPESVAADAETLFRVSREHGAGVYVALSGVLLSWAQGRLNNARRGADDLRKALAELAGQGNRAFTPVFHGFLAELQTAAGETERALAAIDEGFTTARDGGQHFADAFLHRLRGDILLKRSPANPRPAEEAYRMAIAIAKEQGALSYELLASLALAKLYQSTSRLAEAYAVLAPALEGFAPTDEMPEIAEARSCWWLSRPPRT
jgi:predicted ATPase